jgi:hypothetical protein
MGYWSDPLGPVALSIAVVLAVAVTQYFRRNESLFLVLTQPRGLVLIALPWILEALLESGIDLHITQAPARSGIDHPGVLLDLLTLAGLVVFKVNHYAVTKHIHRRWDPVEKLWATIDSRGGLRFLIALGILGLIGPVAIDRIAPTLGIEFSISTSTVIVSALVGSGALLLGGLEVVSSNERTRLVIYETGITHGGQTRTFVPWSAYRGYRVTDESVTLVNRWFGGLRIQRDSIENCDTVISILDQYLDRIA